MFLDFLISGTLFAAIVVGLAWPVSCRLSLDNAERLLATVVLSLVGCFVLSWIVYVASLPISALWLLPAICAVGLLTRVRALSSTLRDGLTRHLALSQILVSLSCVGWLALVVDYSGGKWVGDWFGHWQRALFFLERWPRDLLFNGFDPLPSRPPLANIVNGALLHITEVDFAHYQLFSTLVSSLAFLPAALIAYRFCGGGHDVRPRQQKAIRILTVFFLLSPLFIQNATFAWTKLPAAFFVLSGIYFFLRASDANAPPSASVLSGISVAAGILTHYSAVPYALLLGLGWCWVGWPQRQTQSWRKSTALGVMAGSLILATWFGWAAVVYRTETFTSNTTVTDQAATLSAQIRTIVLNLRDSIVPHFLGGADFTAFNQTSPWGWWRDWFFQLYQCNVFFIFGSVGWIVILMLIRREWRHAAGRIRGFWLFFCPALIVLGIAVHGGREPGGLAHICLQPFVLLALAYLAARWRSLTRTWQRIIIAGTTVDFALGIVLQFAVESHALDRWITPGRSSLATALSYSLSAQINARVKPQGGWIFLGDRLQDVQGWIVAALLVLIFCALYRAARPVRAVANSVQPSFE